jgi:hypothetical protein
VNTPGNSDSGSGDSDAVPSPEENRPGAAPTPTVPSVVTIAFWLWMAAGTLLLAGAVFAFAARREAIDHYISQNKDPNVTPDDIDKSVTMSLWILLISCVMLAAAYGMLALRARTGQLRARTFLAAVGVFGALLMYFAGTLVTFAGGFLGLIALALLYTPPATRYYKHEQG